MACVWWLAACPRISHKTDLVWPTGGGGFRLMFTGMPPKKLGYNWRARQSGNDKRRPHPSLSAGKTGSAASEPCGDTNALVLPPRAEKRLKGTEERAPKRKRLSAKRRKRLMKVLDAKEKKAKRAEVLSQLASLSLPPSQMTHLLPSTSLSLPSSHIAHLTSTKHTHTCPRVSSVREGRGGGGGEGSVKGWKMRRKQRRRRELRREKERRAPLENHSDQMSSASEDESGEGERGVEEVEGEEEGEGGEEEEGEDSAGKYKESEEEREQRVVGRRKVLETVASPSVTAGRSVFVQLQRPVDVQVSRSCLPVVGEEGRIMEVVRDAAVIVVCGETGSGKTTQLPQFLYEYGYTLPTGPCGGGVIGVTEPRRVAAVSMAQRVAYEMGLSQRKVSYQIRYEGNVTDETVIKFMTEGVLLKEIEQDLLLERYSVVIVDEAHERNVFTDILLGLLSRILPLRAKSSRPLKLIVMSATLRVKDFTHNPALFPLPPPTLSVESRQFPVTVHFSKRTTVAYLRTAYQKVARIHRSLPPGHVLVFVTSRSEVLRMCRLLRKTFPSTTQGERCGQGRRTERKVEDVNLDEYPVLPEPAPPPIHKEEGEEEEEEGKEWRAEVSSHDKRLPLLVLPLYSLLSSDRQAEVFQPVSTGVRLCVVATNIAETSITIPGIKYVVDSGKVKRRYYDKVTGISTFRVDWVSKASANQRAGRAGRTEPGHCYRLYSSAVFQNQFIQFSEPDICRRPVEDLVLQMKALGIDHVANFPFPTPPSVEALQVAEKHLQDLGAVSSHGIITSLGRTMTQFPVAPCYAKMLAVGHQHGCLPYVITLVAALSVKELFMVMDQTLSDEGDRRAEERRLTAIRRSWLGKGEYQLLGDLGLLLRAVGAWDYAGGKREFCQCNGLRPRAMSEVAKLRQQLTNTVNTVCSEVNLIIDPKLAPPTQEQARLLRQIVLSGLGNHVARKVSTDHMTADNKKRLRLSYESVSCEGPVYLHPSFLATPPEYVVYQELMDTSNRVYMRGVMAIEEAWLPVMAPQFCTFSKPLSQPAPRYDMETGIVQCHVTCTYGPHSWPLAAQEMTHPPGLQHYRLFAVFLLQGKVCPQLAHFSATLLLPPVTMVKNWAKLHSQTDVLLRALVDRQVCTRQSLLDQWRTDSKYLLKAFSLWLPQCRHSELTSLWPPT